MMTNMAIAVAASTVDEESVVRETATSWLTDDVRSHLYKLSIEKLWQGRYRVNAYTKRYDEESDLVRYSIEDSYFIGVDKEGNVEDRTVRPTHD